MKDLKLQLSKIKPVQVWIFAVLAAGLISLLFDRKDETPSRVIAESADTASTLIPAGFVLVPIEVSNYESLDSILGKFGVVDLYRASSDSKSKPVKVAERVKILRAPLNPSHFAVLVPDSESARLVADAGAYTVVVQNPNRSGTRFVEPGQATSQTGRGSGQGRSSRIAVEVFDAGS